MHSPENRCQTPQPLWTADSTEAIDSTEFAAVTPQHLEQWIIRTPARCCGACCAIVLTTRACSGT